LRQKIALRLRPLPSINALSKASNSNYSPLDIENMRRRYMSIILRTPSLNPPSKLFLPPGQSDLRRMSKRLRGRSPV